MNGERLHVLPDWDPIRAQFKRFCHAQGTGKYGIKRDQTKRASISLDKARCTNNVCIPTVSLSPYQFLLLQLQNSLSIPTPIILTTPHRQPLYRRYNLKDAAHCVRRA